MKPVLLARYSVARFVLLLWLASALILPAADPFAEGVRPTEPLTPADEQKAFRLPPGFEAQLVASEPDILKPMNMAFDEKGRLWVTVTREYPYAAPLDQKGRDAIVILEDNNNDGRADKITTFADGLNIPTGIYPYRGGAIAWSIPHIWHLQDTDGDGQADKRDILYGPLGWERDTHGMNSSFRRGFDGWMYATHGYNNNSTIKGRDGSSITLNSGNTYRVKLDGSRVEQHTWGQVNPFGLGFDPLGNLYSADCHSAPIYQLLDGGYYPSFGKPHDGLGFAPTMLEHSHGSTAIAGIIYYADNLFPVEFQDNIFIGNVMTSRVNRDVLTEEGSTKVARELPDFIATEDPWFRPVDIQLGPDGAVYVADFYNRIIGHYEVPLTHPGRDRTSGRIWRIVYRGADGKQNARPRRDLSRANPGELIAALADPNLTYRLLATDQLVDRVGAPAIALLKDRLKNPGISEFQHLHALWALHQLGAVGQDQLLNGARHPHRAVRTHVMRILAEMPAWSSQLRATAQLGLGNSDAFVQRCAAEAVGRHPAFENIAPLLKLRHSVPGTDTHSLYVARKALRDQLVPAEIFKRVIESTLNAADAEAIADVALGVKTPAAGEYLLKYVEKASPDQETLAKYLTHAARYLPEQGIDSIAGFARRAFPDDSDFQLALLKSVEQGLQQRGAAASALVKGWAGDLATQLLQSIASNDTVWANFPVEGMPDTANPWAVQKRDSADGKKGAPFLCTLPSGEKTTGILRSRPFVLPAQLKFFTAGHDGFPDKAGQKRNVIRLCAEQSGEVLRETFPPRNDLAQPVTWDLGSSAGQRGYVEVVDGDNGSAYAWLAVGRFEPPVVAVPAVNPSTFTQRQVAVADLAGRYELRALEEPLQQILRNDKGEADARAASGRALLRLNPTQHLPALGLMLQDGNVAIGLREQLGQLLGEQDLPAAREFLVNGLRLAPQRLQSKLALALAGQKAGADALLKAVADKEVSPKLLLERPVKDKILAAKPTDARARLDRLTQNLTPPDEKVAKLVEQRRQSYSATQASASSGRDLFTKNCAACHQVAGEGSLVGPQLDGIGNRGLDRLTEDVLDPNRNVDRAFRSTLFILSDGDVVSGLFRRDEGELIILAESTGKEISVPRKTVQERKESETSLMPENFAELLTPEDFNHLMAYLLAQRANASGK